MNEHLRKPASPVFHGLLAFQRLLVAVTDSVDAGLMLAHMWYWKDQVRDANGWFCKTHYQWFHETGLSRRCQDAARLILRSRGLIEERRSGIPARLYFRVNTEAVNTAVARMSRPTRWANEG